MPLNPEQRAEIDAVRGASQPTRRATVAALEEILHEPIPVVVKELPFVAGGDRFYSPRLVQRNGQPARATSSTHHSARQTKRPPPTQ